MRGTEVEGTNPLMRWPASIEGSELVLVPGSPGPLGTLTLETLANISASDWSMLHALCDVIISTLQQPNLTQNASQSIDVQYWLNALVPLKSQFAKTANIFRFDNVVLYREQVNPGYEHLWLKFSNVRSGDEYLPNFTFRLSAAGVRPGKFSVPLIGFILLGLMGKNLSKAGLKNPMTTLAQKQSYVLNSPAQPWIWSCGTSYHRVIRSL
jgi:hypothetical protein